MVKGRITGNTEGTNKPEAIFDDINSHCFYRSAARLTGSLPTEHLGGCAVELNNIRELYDYNRWAGRRTLTVASRLANDDFLRPMGNSFSSVRDTLSHILGAEWIWLERWHGRSPKALLDPASFPTVQSGIEMGDTRA